MTAPTIRDFAPLVGTVPSPELAGFRRSVRGDPAYSATGIAGIGSMVAAVAAGLFMVVVGLAVAAGSFAPGIARGSVLAIVSGAVMALVCIVLAGLGVAGVYLLRQRQWERWYRMAAFARANGLVFAPTGPEPSLPGMVFGRGSARRSSDRFIRHQGRYLEYGNYRFTTGSGKSRKTHSWGYLALQLDRRLPHMVLDAKSNNPLLGSNLPEALARDQQLSLEGDFDRYFTLYCPREYERDALYVFTPDLMALLIDEAAQVDVEIVDSWMLLYSGAAFALHEPAIQQRLASIVDTVGVRTLDQTERYRDERALMAGFADYGVAPAGRRLRRGVPVGVLVAIAVVAAAAILPRLLWN